VTAPAVFKYTAASNPARHLAAAELFGVDISNARAEDAGEILSDQLKKFLVNLEQPRGIKAFGYGGGDIEALVDSTLPQRRVLMLAPSFDEQIDRQREALAGILENSITF
jgi:hydroxyacid-oxoacid transhydrogenase